MRRRQFDDHHHPERPRIQPGYSAGKTRRRGPVIITDRGEPAYVLQRYIDWRHQTGAAPSVSLLDAIADPDSETIEFEPPRIEGPLARPLDLE
jgi:hypothetical protein